MKEINTVLNDVAKYKLGLEYQTSFQFLAKIRIPNHLKTKTAATSLIQIWNGRDQCSNHSKSEFQNILILNVFGI